MKTGKDFKLAKSTKRMMALLPFKDQGERNSFKRGMIDAQAAAEKASRDNQRGRGSNNGTE